MFHFNSELQLTDFLFIWFCCHSWLYAGLWIQLSKSQNLETWTSFQWLCWIIPFLCHWGLFLFLFSMKWIISPEREFLLAISISPTLLLVSCLWIISCVLHNLTMNMSVLVPNDRDVHRAKVDISALNHHLTIFFPVPRAHTCC